MTTTADVTVVVPVYNGERFVAETLRSALDQTAPPHRIVVVDDGSTDGTIDVLRSFGDAIEVVQQANRGVAAARNAGARSATTDYLAFLDADDLWLPTKLERQVAALGEAPAVGMVHCGVLEFTGDGEPLRERTDGKAGAIAADLVRWEEPAVLGGGSGALFRRSVFEQVGGYDEQLSTSADWDLFLRVALVADIAFLPEVLVHYRMHDSNMHKNVALLERDMTRAMDKAFESAPSLRVEERRARSNLAYALGGAYLENGERPRAARHLLRAIWMRPALLGRVLKAGSRRLS